MIVRVTLSMADKFGLKWEDGLLKWVDQVDRDIAKEKECINKLQNLEEDRLFIEDPMKKGTIRQRSGKGAIRKRFPLQKPRWEKTKPTIRHLYHETYRKPNEQLFSQ